MFYFATGYSPFTSNGQQAKPNPNGTAGPFTLHSITLHYTQFLFNTEPNYSPEGLICCSD